jgi:hypothetical protein
MATTITTDTYLDTATGTRVAGEAWIVQGCTFTVRTDTRVYAGAPAGMTGSLSGITGDSGKGSNFVIDGSKIRWMAFDTGSGTVPAIGTTISQGGVTAYLLGVWADYVSAPISAGGAMPATGYMKFREVNNGSFSAGALTGISANASSPDVTGWLEYVSDAGANIAPSAFGNGITVKGDWFYLGTTSGSPGQQINTPTNGGGSTTFVNAVQIETAPGSGVFEWYPAMTTTTTALGNQLWSTTNITTDIRAKFVEAMPNGIVRIGSDGTNNIGYTPVAGCRIRMPNVICRTVTTSARATNATPGVNTRPTWNCIRLNLSNVHSEYAFSNSINTIQLVFNNSCNDTVITVSSTENGNISNSCIGGFITSAAVMLNINYSTTGSVSNTKVVNQPFSSGAINITYSSNLTFTNIESVSVKVRTTTTFGISANSVANVTISGYKCKGVQPFTLTNASNWTITNVDHVDRVEGPTTATASVNVVTISGCNTITLDTLTFGENGQLANTQPYGNLLQSSSPPSTNVKIRNFGTRANPLNCGSSATFYPSGLYLAQTGDSYMKFQRIYLTGVRSTALGQVGAASQGMLFEDIYIGTFPTNTIAGRNAIARKIASANASSVATSGASGCHWIDGFSSDAAGYIKWYAVTPTPESQDKNYLVVTPAMGTGYTYSSTGLSLDTLNDYAFSESQWMFIGHTGFQNAAPTANGTSTGYTYYYDLDIGNGFRGTWTLATGANLAAETIPSTGFKMRLKVLQTSSSTTLNSLNYVMFLTNTSPTAQQSAQYPLDTNTLTFTGLQTGSEVQCYVGTNPATSVLVGGTNSSSGSTFSFTHSVGGQAGYIMVFALGYDAIYIPYTYKTTDDSILIQQIVDRNYYNPV